MDYSEETLAFLKEREEKLGGRLIYRTYSTWFGSAGGLKREYGVFLYSDGSTLVIEDFERNPRILGIEYTPKKKAKYEKLEIIIPISEISDVDKITRSSAESSIKLMSDRSKVASTLDRALRKTCARLRLKNGDVYYLEVIDIKELRALIDNARSKE